MVMDAKQRLDFVGRLAGRMHVPVNDVVFETLPSQMHVGHETEQGRVIRQSPAGFDAKIGIARRNQKMVIGELQGQDALPGRLL